MFSRTMTRTQADELIAQIKYIDRAAEGDSNDREIEALQDFRDLAMGVLGIEQDDTAHGYRLREERDAGPAA